MLVGILGLGSIGQRHARNLMTLGHQVLAYDPEQLSHPREIVINQSDAVLICTPTKQHVADLIDVLQAGKHVLVEKPIGYDCPPCIAGLIMGARLKNPNLVIATGFMCRFHPEVRRAKTLIEQGKLGKIKKAEFIVKQHNDKPTYLRDGVIRNWASHEIDIAHYLLGPMHVDSCEVTTHEDQDISAKITCSNVEEEFPIVIDTDYLTKPEIRGFRIIGDKDGYQANLTLHDWDKVYLDEMKTFISAVEGGGRGPLADGADGVAALQVVMDARKRARLDE